MYTTDLSQDTTAPESQNAAFEAKIAADNFIEPKDWMPEPTAKPSSARSPSTHTPKSSVCSPKATD